MTNKELGEKIRINRTLKGRSQASLANEIGSSQKYISRIENGKTSPSFELINKICGALELDLIGLISISENSNTNRKVI